MNREVNRLKIEHGAERQAAVPFERLRDDAGNVVTFPAARAELAARRRGLHADNRGALYFFPVVRDETPEERGRREMFEAEWERRREEDRLWEAEYERRKKGDR